ncbi:hypothetical protein EV699_12050 [Plasticicumulans lactativorans]|uniref:Tetratricopeptide repeat protein n=1 Tax=Plasticicumulans lactativorans TaxID=1133106 RepID=A0A4R2L120_9GAMM|nr:hypothetical protein [Plasticicumulans lactativorans]TCO79272.1 hypothetical protein EV699_12050 [Plasticicumulans lactativorans]
MNAEQWESVWHRVRAGRHTLLLGADGLPDEIDGIRVLRVDCTSPWATGGVLSVALRKVVQALGGELPAEAPAAAAGGLQQRLLGELPRPALDARFVDACNRLADAGGTWVLALEAVDAADAASLAALEHILRRSGWLRLPLLLTLRGVAGETVGGLVDALGGDPGALVEAPPALAAGEAAFDWRGLPPATLRVLRAAALIGASFEAELVAGLLDVPLGAVLEALQEAADAGVPLDDRGEGLFRLSAAAVEELRRGMLPSLREHWHERLGRRLSRAPGVAALREPPPGVAAAPSAAPPPAPAAPVADYAGLFQPPAAPVAPPPAPPAAAAGGVPAAAVPGEAPPPADAAAALAAQHLQAAGRSEAAAEQYLAAIRDATAQGDTRRVPPLAAQALRLLESLPVSRHRALLQARLMVELGRAQWQGAVLDPSFTLPAARQSLGAAWSLLPNDAPPAVLGELASVSAEVACELGDVPMLERAFAALADACRRVLTSGDALAAVQLCNEQAAIAVHLGDPAAAIGLLSQSREWLNRQLQATPQDPLAIERLGQTEHLLARLALHAPVAPAQERQACAVALGHAAAAEHAYRHLGQRRGLARVLETSGRLQLRQGQIEAARQALLTAAELQNTLGDVTGLARTTEALAELLTRTGQAEQAAAALGDSIALNVEKGSPIGLAFNRRALEALVAAGAHGRSAPGGTLEPLLDELQRRLNEAEAMLGRVDWRDTPAAAAATAAPG